MAPAPEASLPIDSLRDQLLAALVQGSVVVQAPTGTGKSTQVPRWCRDLGRVLVVEPRRVACRTLAQRVAELERTPLGTRVGYRVRDEHRGDSRTEILFATPGIVLRQLEGGAPLPFDVVILDELHERGLEVDLLLALFLHRRTQRLVVMSATLDGDRVARHLDARLLRVETRSCPVERRYLPGATLLPDGRGLESRVVAAVEEARDLPGDVLVFLPGKAEIRRVAETLSGRHGLEVLPLHGGLTLEQQATAFATSPHRKVVLATNVAETSVTIPGIGVVVDSGLVRRTRYHQGRGFLSLLPIAADSAEQRAGRAGRTGPGVCLRLWSRDARLETQTPPEVLRESLAPLVLAAAACGAAVNELPFLDAPRGYALEAAVEELSALGAIDAGGGITRRGRELFGLPVDAFLGRLLLEAERAGCLVDMVDLVAALGAGRPLFRGEARPETEEDDLRASGCDGRAFVNAVRRGRPGRHRLSAAALDEARTIRARLVRAFDLPRDRSARVAIDTRLLALTALRSDPRCAHVARRRRGKVAWSNGGTEIGLGRDSAVDAAKVDAIVVLQSHAAGVGRRRNEIVATCALPIPLPILIEAGLGEDRLARVSLKGGRMIAVVERVFARKVLQTSEEAPRGRLVSEAIATLFLDGKLFPEVRDQTRERLYARELLTRLRVAGLGPSTAAVTTGRMSATAMAGEAADASRESVVVDFAEWVRLRLDRLGVETPDDLALLSPSDLLAPDLPAEERQWLDHTYPRQVTLGDGRFAVSYDLAAREARLRRTAGRPGLDVSAAYLPPLPRLRVVLEERGKVRVLRP